MDYKDNENLNNEDDFFDSLDAPKKTRARRVSTLHKKKEEQGFEAFEAGEADFSDLAHDYTDENGLDPDFDYDPFLENAEKRTGTQKKVRELNSASTAINAEAVKEQQQQKKKSRIKKIIFWTVLEIFTLAAIFAYGYFLRSWNLISRPEINEDKIENNNISLAKKQEMEQGWWTFAVFGVDGRSASDLVSKGLNSDVIIIVNINLDNGEIRMCNVFRDTYLNISDNDSYRKINAAYCNGGPEQALAALNKNLDLNIKNYVTFNWKAVADGINILGGIDNIDISKAEFYYINAFITETVQVTKIGSHQLTKPGTQHLDGVQAVAYGRLRLMDSDYARVERQKKVIKACFEKAKTANFSVLNNIMVVCFPEVATNINFNDVVALAQNITKYNITETGGFPWMRSETANAKIGDVIVPATLESNVIKLHDFLFDDANYQPSSACLRYSETIKEKTGIYKEGQVIESVRTDGGLISTPKTSAAETEGGSKSGQEETETDESGKVVEKPTIGVDENGNYVYPTDSSGQLVIPKDKYGRIQYPTDEYGNIIYETDAQGNVVNPTNADGSPYTTEETRPSETEEGEGDDGPGESSHGDDVPVGPDGKPLKPRETQYGPGMTDYSTGTTEYFGPGHGTQATTNESSKPDKTTEASGEDGPGSGSSSGGSSDGPGGSGSSSGGSQGGPGSGSSSGSSSGGPGSNTDGPGAPGGSSGGSSDGPGGSGSSSGSSSGGPGSTDGPGAPG